MRRLWRGLRTSLNEKGVEWLLTLIILSWGVRLLAFPDSPFANNPINYAFLSGIASEEAWGWFCLVGGIVRAAVLVINGAWRASPHLRALLCILGLLFWTMLTLGFIHAGAMGTALTAYPWFALFEIGAAMRAAKQAAVVDRERSAWSRTARGLRLVQPSLAPQPSLSASISGSASRKAQGAA